MSATYDNYNYEYEWFSLYATSVLCDPDDEQPTSLPSDADGNIIQTYLYTPEEELKFLNWLNSGNISAALDFLDFVYYLKSPYTSFKRYLLYNITNTIVVYIADSTQDTQILNEKLLPLFNHDTIGGRYQQLKAIITKICEQNKPRKGSKLCVRVHGYIESHYLDKNLSVNSIADALDLHYVYLSSSFKKHSGYGVSDCINQIRIKKSKFLLADLSNSIEEVALAVGYSTKKTYARIFRNLEGISPSKYREIHFKMPLKQNHPI